MHSRFFSTATPILLTLALGSAGPQAKAADDSTLDLTDQPVVTGSSLAPNILVAVDNSGSMDFETLFSTTEGELYVNGGSPYTTSNGRLNSPNSRNGNSFARYAYLFPNGYHNVRKRHDVGRGGMLYPDHYPIPPTSQFAFARSSIYNKSYFDPSNIGQYKPWTDPAKITVEHSSDQTGETYKKLDSLSAWQSAPYDPTKPSLGTLNLISETTGKTRKNKFAVFRGMSTAGSSFYGEECHRFGWSGQRCHYDWQNGNEKQNFGSSEFTYFKYYPATFFMPAPGQPDGWTPPKSFGWSGHYDQTHPGQSTIGWRPNGSKTLKRYRITQDNFVDQEHYRNAITAFANWFTYYRKRNLAIRGGITAAFDQIGNVHVGSCTINEALGNAQYGRYKQLSMRDLSDKSERSEFYSSVYGMNFYQALGTPNRPALYYLGRELENNPHIITSPCQRNYAILFTDGINSEGVSGVGNVDGDSHPDFGPPFADDASNTIADIAMKYYSALGSVPKVKDSARGHMPVDRGCRQNHPPKSLDCQSDLHMTTFGVTLGQRGILFNPDSDQDPYTNPPNWRRLGAMSSNGGIQQIDDLWHATINSRGALLNAASPKDIASRFTSVLNQILGRGETLTNATGNSTSLTTDSAVFQTSYKADHWTGDLTASGVQNDSTRQGDPTWSAAKQLKDQNPNDRIIWTALRSGGALKEVPFTQTALKDADIDGLDAWTIAYIRGDHKHEQTGTSDDTANGRIYRKRDDNVLGDIVHSVPAYVGRPAALRYAGRWQDALYPDKESPEKNSYYDSGGDNGFVTAQADREAMVYVGANDGMLHGFDANTGVEKLAYIPNAVLGSLAGGGDPLTSPAYRHRSFVDGQVATGPAFFPPNSSGQWHTMLVGGLRNGGKAIYALDITDPSSFKKSSSDQGDNKLVRWEFTDSGLGKTYGKPSIVRLHNGQWAAIFGNGYNSKDGDAGLYVVYDIANGRKTKRLNAGNGPKNGLAMPSPVDIDGDHITDYVYAGDLHGNVWRFDLTSKSPTGWTAHKIFHATHDGHDQPITTQVQVAAHPNGIGYGVMIYFGTGQDIEPLDGDQSSQPNNFYGIWDPDVFSYDSGIAGPPRPSEWSVTRDQLVTQKVKPANPTNGVSGLSYRTVTNNPVTYIDKNHQIADRGWVIDLPKGSGEAILNPPKVVDNNVQFSTTAINRQTCSLTSSGYFMAVSRVNGGPAAKDIFDVNGDGVVDDKDASTPRVAGIGFGAESGSPGQGPSFNDLDNATQVIKTPLTGGGTATITLARDFLNGRRSWHEIRR